MSNANKKKLTALFSKAAKVEGSDELPPAVAPLVAKPQGGEPFAVAPQGGVVSPGVVGTKGEGFAGLETAMGEELREKGTDREVVRKRGQVEMEIEQQAVIRKPEAIAPMAQRDQRELPEQPFELHLAQLEIPEKLRRVLKKDNEMMYRKALTNVRVLAVVADDIAKIASSVNTQLQTNQTAIINNILYKWLVDNADLLEKSIGYRPGVAR